MDSVIQFDHAVLHGVNSLSGTYFADWVVHYITENKILSGVIFLAVYWFYWFGGRSQDTGKTRRFVIAGLISCCIAIILARVMADILPFRVRPLADPASGYIPPTIPATDEFEIWSSFPSDKAAFVFALSFGLYAIAPRVSIILALYSLIAICIPRIYLGIHYPSDILVGAVIGAACGLSAHRIIRGRWLNALEIFAERQRPFFYALAFLVTDELGFLFRTTRHTARSIKELMHAPTLEVPVLITAGILAVLVLAGVGGRHAYRRMRSKALAKTSTAPTPIGPAVS